MAKHIRVKYIMNEDMTDDSIYGCKKMYNVCFMRGREEMHALLTPGGRHIKQADFSTPNHPNDIRALDQITDDELAQCQEALAAFRTLVKYKLAYSGGIELED